MPLALTIVDAFAAQPFRGNPAAVAVLDRFPDDERMQAVAGELNLSETAFVARRDDGELDLRWFTPLVEVDLCGHATLAAAHLLGGTARFHTRSGVLACRSAGPGLVEMDLPSDVAAPTAPQDLGIPGVVWYGLGRDDALVVLEDATALRSLRPDLARLAALGTRCVILTAPGDRPGIDIVSRVFCPNAGIPEDPVTGSAHCTLATYWAERLDRARLHGEQASRRGGLVQTRLAGDRVVVGGPCVTVAEVRVLL